MLDISSSLDYATNATKQQFVERFFDKPTPDEIQRDFSYLMNPGYPKEPVSYGGARLFRHFREALDDYAIARADEHDKLFGSLDGKKSAVCISDGVSRRILALAVDYATLGVGHSEYHHNPAFTGPYFRLYSLISHPSFIADKSAPSVLERLADLTDAEPWGFEMYLNFDQSEEKYHLKPGFGKSQIEGFARIIGTDRLWDGKSKEMKRVFFSSVAEALAYLAADFPEETFDPRIAVMEGLLFHRNITPVYQIGNSFSSNELSKIEKIASACPTTRLSRMLGKIVALRPEGKMISYAC